MFQWVGTSITWNNRPGGSASWVSGSTPVSGAYGGYYYNFNMTSLVKAWYNGTVPNYGVVIGYYNESYNDYNWLGTGDGSASYTPSLTINYNGAISYITLTKGVPVSGTITQGGEYWYRFVAPKTRSYTFCSSGSTDTYGELYQGSTLLQSDDDGGEGLNFSITRNLTGGAEYLLKVRGYGSATTGSYFVLVKDWQSVSKPTIKPRSAWGARPPRSVLTDREVANTKRVIFHHTANNFNSTNINSIIDQIQKIQNKQMDNPDPIERTDDIAYHYIIDPAGNIWEGRAMNKQGAHTKSYNNDIGVAILGDFQQRLINPIPNTLNQNQKNAMEALSKWLCYSLDLKIISPGGIDEAPINWHKNAHQVIDPNQVCPGGNSIPWIQNTLRPNIIAWGS